MQDTDPRNTTQKARVQCRQDFIVQNLQTFYNESGNLEKIIPILKGESPISLRLVDWFITNYAKKNNTSYMMGTKQFLVHFNYKRELKAYSKKLFDPFCRRERIMFQARGVEPFVTTVGQLNFFRWFIEKEILEYVLEHQKTIETDMNKTLKEHYSRSNSTVTDASATEANVVSSGDSTPTSKRKKRCELTTSAMKKVNVHECEVTVSFC